MTVKELKKWLNHFPDDAEVHIPVLEESRNWSPDTTKFQKFEGESCCDYEYIDFTKNQFVKVDHPFYGKKALFLGEQS